MNKLFVVFFSFLFSFSLISQEKLDSASLNLQKYWYYRWRFQNDFTFVGEGQGRSLPIQSRKGIRWVQDIEFVDATLYLGFYWSILATENKLLRINERWDDLEKNKTELYYAIKAFERLDKAGETFLGKEAKVDGYFMRDDVPGDFIDSVRNRENYEHFNQKKTIAPGTTPVCNVMVSDFYNAGNPENHTINFSHPPEMSQDQVIWLSMGALFIAQSLPEGIDSVQLLNGEKIAFDFVGEAKRHITNMINYCRFKYPKNSKRENWQIYNPLGNKVWPGQNVFMFKYPLSIIGEKLYNPQAENNQPFHPKGRFQWNLTRVWIPYKNVNGQMIAILATLSNDWGKNPIKTRDKIYKTVSDNGWGPFYLMMLNYFHDTPIEGFDVVKNVERDLSLAPTVGPYLMNRDIFADYTKDHNFPPYTYEWSRHLKYSSQREMVETPEKDIYTYRGFYAGLDYMLLLNLYYLTTDKPLPKYQNLADRVVDDASLNLTDRTKPASNAFNTITLKLNKELQQFIVVRAPFGLLWPANYQGMKTGKVNVENTLFNPWNNQLMKSNTYGWNEQFPLVNHLEKSKLSVKQ